MTANLLAAFLAGLLAGGGLALVLLAILAGRQS